MNLHHNLFMKETDTLFSALPLPLFASWFNSMFLAWMLIGQIDSSVLIMWIGANTVLTLLRYGIYFYYRRNRAFHPVRTFYLLYFGGMAMSSLLWGSTALFLFPESLIYAVLVVFIAGGMTAGALGSVAYRFETYLIYNLTIMLPFIIVLHRHSAHEFHIMGFILILFSAMLIISGKKFHSHFLDALTLQFEQQALSDSLQSEKKNIEKLNSELYDKIIENESIQASLRNALEEAEQASKAKDAFFATMSHELRTPLNAILGFSQILFRKNEFPPQFKDFIEKIFISGNHLLELVNSILDFSKMRAGKMTPLIDSIHLADLMTDLKAITEPLAHKKAISILFPDNPDLVLRADRKMLHQILLNLLSNAIKFSPPESTVTLTYHNHNEHLLCVCDEGSGIASENLLAIFDPFVQVKRNLIEQQGTGLGLAIVKEMVQAHGGEIWVESTEGKGSCFYVALPLNGQSPITAAE
ncbi:MAG: sensor histidine kinase [Sulfuricurvum sp.]